MPKTIFIIPALLLFATVVSAQQVSIGIRAGYTLSDVLVKEPDGLIIEGDPNYELDGRFRPLSSFHAGLDARFSLNERWSIVAGLLYARKGYVGELDWPTGPAKANWELHYLNLPVAVDYRIWNGLSLQGGMEFGRLMSARLKSAGEDADGGVFFEDYDLGLVAGLEYQIKGGFFVGARHIFGIYSIQELELTDQNGARLGASKNRNSATQLSVGYRRTIGRQ